MKLSKKYLRRIIAEEISRLVSEMDYINIDTGEILEVPDTDIPSIEQALGIDMSGRDPEEPSAGSLRDDDFSKLWRHMNPPAPPREDREAAALDRLRAAAKDAASDYLGDNPEADPGVLHDLALGIEHTVSEEDWNDAWAYFDFDDAALVEFLVDSMYDAWEQ